MRELGYDFVYHCLWILLNRMKLWVRYIEEATEWHWCKNCPEYPRGDRRLILLEKPKYGSFCSQCAALEKDGKCDD